jgi:hypothetical protein
MATVERLGEALKNAHAAGDEYAAKKFADAIRKLQTASAPTPAEPEETSLLGYGLETGKALLGGAAGLLESAATGAAFILPEEAEQAARARIAEIGGGVQEFLAPGEAYEDSTYLDLMRGVGSTVPFLAAAPFGAVGLAAGALTGITAGAGEAAQRAVAAGATEEEISKAAGLGTIPGALEMFGPARIVGRFRKVLGTNADDVAEELSGSIVRKISQAAERAPLGRVGKAAIDEGIQEAIAEVGQNLIQRGVYDPERGVFTDTGESFGLGAGVGGLLQGLAEAIIPGRQRAAARKAEEAAAAEQAAVTEGEAVAGEEAMAAVPVDETRDMFPEERAAAEQQFQGPEPERLLDVEELAGVTEEAPIQVRPAPTPETDLIADLEETQQVEEMLVEDELDAMQAEEDAARANLDAAVDQELSAIDIAEREAALRDVQQRIETRRAEETQAKRGPVLEAVLAQTSTASQVNTEKAFADALAEAGIADTTPTEAERQAITQKTYELAQQRPAPEVVEPEVVADGTGTAELEAFIPEAGARQAQREAAPEAAPTTLVTPEFFDSLGIPKSAPIRRRKALQGKEVSSPEVQEALQALIKNPKTSNQTRANLLNYRAFGEVVTPTAKPTPTASTAAQPTAPDAPRTFANTSQPIAATVALPDTDEKKLVKQKNTPLPKRNKYTPKPAMSYYMQNATDSDQALRIIAFEGLVDPTLETTSPKDVGVLEKKRADAAAQWVESNLSPESKNKLKEYQEFYKRELAQLTAKGDVFLERMNAQQALAREEGKTSDEYIEAENERNQEILQEQIAEEFAARNAEAYVLSVEGLPETELDGAVVELLRGTSSDSIADIDGLVDYLRSNAVAASMPLVSAETNNKLLDGDLKGALKQLALDSPNKMVRDLASNLEKAIGTTKIEFVDTLENTRGDQFAGNYTASQDLIQININAPLSSHTILHEVAHAVTSKTLDNPGHPFTIQLTKLFNDVKGKIPGTYGSESLKDFVAEVYTNPDFRATLAAHKPTGSKLTAWQRFTNAIKRLFGMPTTETETVADAALDFVDLIVAESISTRNATVVEQKLSDGDALRAAYEMMGGGTALAKLKTLKDSKDWILGNAQELGAKSRMTMINAMTLDNIVNLIKEKLPSAADFQNFIRKQDGKRNELMKNFGNKLRDFKEAFKDDSAATETYNTLVGLSTIEEVDPTKPAARYKNFGYSYTDTNGNIVEKVTFPTEAQRDEAIEALDKTKILAGVRKLNTTQERITAYEEAQRLYNKLSPTQKTAYRDMRDMYKQINADILAAIDDKLDKLEIEAGVKATVKDRVFRKLLTSGVIDPYFPLNRPGEFWVEYVYKDRDGQVRYGVSSHPTEGRRKVAINALNARTDIVTGSVKAKPRPDMSSQGFAVPTGFLVDLLAELKKPVTIVEKDANGNDVEKQVTLPQGAIDFVDDVLIKSLPEQNLIQGHMGREGFAGYETQAIKAFEDTYPTLVNSLANLSFDADFALVANKIREEAAAGANADDRLVQDVMKALIGTPAETNALPGKLSSYLEFVKNPNLPNWARRLRSSSFIYTLGFNVSSAAVNMSTLPMVVGPLLAGKFGLVNATSAMSRASTMYLQSFGDVTREGITKEGEIGEISELGGFSYANKEGGLLGPLVKKLKELGLDTRTITSENADYENPTAPLLNKIAYVSSFIFNHSERAIRQITAGSAYILEMEKKYGKPIDKLTEAQIEAHGEKAAQIAIEFMDYANSSALLATAPRWAQSGIGSIIYQFKRFPAQILYIQMDMLNAIQKQARGKTRTPEQIEEDRALRNAFIYMNATGAALVGAKGVPFYGLVAAIANMFLGEDEDDVNTIVAKTLGEGAFYGGVAKYFGTDVTDRVALTNLLIRDKGNYRPENTIQYGLESFGGPTIGIGIRLGTNIARYFDDDPRNDTRAIEGMLPTAISNGKKAYRYATEGYETTRGDAIVGEVTVGDAILQTMGFAPSKFRAEQDKLARDRRVTTGVDGMRKGLLDRFAFAHNNGDEAGKKKVIEDIREFNQKHGNVAISGDTLRQSIKTRARGSAIAEQLGGNVADRRFIRALIESRQQYTDRLYEDK